MEDELIQPAEGQELVEEPQVQEPQELQYNEPEVEDTYNPVEEQRKQADFDKWLNEQYPIKGNADLSAYDKKDPASAKKYLEDMQNNIRSDINNEHKREELKRQYEAQQENARWAAVDKAYPTLRQNKPVYEMIRTFHEGASSKGMTPLQSAKLVNKIVFEAYNQGFRAARQHTEQVPSRPLGKQGKAQPVRLNEKAIRERASGDLDDVTAVVDALQKAGVGGL